jgi:transposase
MYVGEVSGFFETRWLFVGTDGFDFLPLYSPDINPIERVWKITRQLCLHNVYFAKLDQVCAILLSNSLSNGESGAVRSKKLCAIT